DIRYIIEFILKDSDFDVSLSPTAKDFDESIDHSQPDLILLDIMLPDGDGRDICRRLKTNESTKNIPVVMMSAHAAEKDVIESCFANDFIKKPFDIDNFLSRINKLID
ncbi:MAG: response regulator, partial [Pedobacter sp.]